MAGSNLRSAAGEYMSMVTLIFIAFLTYCVSPLSTQDTQEKKTSDDDDDDDDGSG